MPNCALAGNDAEPPIEHRLLHSVDEAAVLLSVGVSTLRNCIVAGLIRIIRKGRRVLIPHSELVRFARLNHHFPLRYRAESRRHHHAKAKSEQQSQGLSGPPSKRETRANGHPEKMSNNQPNKEDKRE